MDVIRIKPNTLDFSLHFNGLTDIPDGLDLVPVCIKDSNHLFALCFCNQIESEENLLCYTIKNKSEIPKILWNHYGPYSHSVLSKLYFFKLPKKYWVKRY